MKTKGEKAAEIFSGGYNCAQAVLASYCEDFGVPDETAKKVAGGFGGGMGYIGETCGAVTGAIMAIGLKHGKYKDDMPSPRDGAYKIVKQYTDEMKKEFGTIKCFELLKYDLSDPDEYAKAREAGVFKTVCPVLVKRSAEILEKYI